MDCNNLKSNGARDRLISLINEKKSGFHEGAAAVVRCEFDLIAEARKNGASWKEIVDAIGFPGKEDGFAVAFFRERRRRSKKGKEVVPEKKRWIPAPKEEKTEVPRSDEPASSATGTTGSTGVRGPIQKKDESGEKKVHLIEEDDQKEKNLFERSKLY